MLVLVFFHDCSSRLRSPLSPHWQDVPPLVVGRFNNGLSRSSGLDVHLARQLHHARLFHSRPLSAAGPGAAGAGARAAGAPSAEGGDGFGGDSLQHSCDSGAASATPAAAVGAVAAARLTQEPAAPLHPHAPPAPRALWDAENFSAMLKPPQRPRQQAPVPAAAAAAERRRGGGRSTSSTTTATLRDALALAAARAPATSTAAPSRFGRGPRRSVVALQVAAAVGSADGGGGSGGVGWVARLSVGTSTTLWMQDEAAQPPAAPHVSEARRMQQGEVGPRAEVEGEGGAAYHSRKPLRTHTRTPLRRRETTRD